MAACLFSVSSRADNSGITYQGRILKPDGTALEGSNVQFRLQIRAPDANGCLMYEELKTLDMRNSKGQFALTMNDGNGVRMDSSGYGLDRIFSNFGSFNFVASTCISGSTYVPGTGDGRSLVVQFKDETMASWEPMAPQKINFVPFAFAAKQIAGFGADSLLRVIDGSGDPLTGLSPLSNTEYSELLALVNGTTTQYAHANGVGFTPTSAVSFNSQRITNLATPSSAGDAVNKSYADSNLGGTSVNTAVIGALGAGDAGKVLSWNGTTWTAGTSLTSQWTTYGSAVAYTAGNVGVGTTAPGAVVDVARATNLDSLVQVSNPDPGTAARAGFNATNGVGSVSLMMSGPNYASGGDFTANWGAVRSSSAADGLVVASAHGPVAFNANGIERMRLTSGGSVGIGTTNPFAYLHVLSASNASNTAVFETSGASFSADALTVNNTGATTGNLLKLRSLGADRVIVTGAGMIGVGTTAPQAPVHIYTTSTTGSHPYKAGFVVEGDGASSIGGRAAAVQFGNTSYFAMYRADGSKASPSPVAANVYLGQVVAHGWDGSNWATGSAETGIYFKTREAFTPTARGSAMMFYTTPLGTSNGAEMMRIEAGGNVGIGTTSPLTRLHVAGTLTLGNGSETCTGGNFAGALRYNVATTSVEFCNGTGWLVMSAGSGSGVTNSSSITSTTGITMTTGASDGVVINSTLASTSPTTGALTVAGGIGASGDVYSSGAVHAGTSVYATTSGYFPQIYGASTPAANIKIDGTSDVSKGNVLLASAGGNVGIGTTAPGSTLTVAGDISTFTSGSSKVWSGYGGNYIYMQEGAQASISAFKALKFNTNGTNNAAMYIDTAANVGIGTTSPTYPLDVTGTARAGQLISQSSNATFSPYVMKLASGGTDTKFWDFYQDSSSFALRALDDAYAGSTIGLSFTRSGLTLGLTRIGGNNVTMAGKVGIGTTAPGQALDVVGQSQATATSVNGISGHFRGAATGDANVVLQPDAGSGSAWWLTAPAAGGLWIGGVGSSEPTGGIINIDTTAKVGIGTTAPGYKFDVNGSLNASSIYLNGSALSSSAQWATNGTDVYRGSGKVGIGTTSPTATLDIAGSTPSTTQIIENSSTTLYSVAGFSLANTANAAANQTVSHFLQNNTAGGGGTGDYLLRHINYNGASTYFNFMDYKLNGTSSSLTFNSPSGLFFQQNGATALTINSSGNVGIGTTAPTGIFHVVGGTAVTDTNATSVTISAQNGGALSSGTATNGGNIVLMPGTKSGTGVPGTVSVGTASPPNWVSPTSLYVYSNIYAGGSFQTSNAAGYKLGDSTMWMGFGGAGATGYLTYSTNNTERLRIDGSGNVGIGTTAPGAVLDVNAGTTGGAAGGSITVHGTNDPAVRVVNGSTEVGVLAAATNPTSWSSIAAANDAVLRALSGNMIIASKNATGSVIFTTGALDSEKMRVSNNGNVGIGTTAPQATLDINGFARLKVNSSAPVACSTANDGALAMTSSRKLCSCNGPGASWINSADGTACVW